MLIIAMTSMVLAGCQKQDTVTEVPTPAPEPGTVAASLSFGYPSL